MTLVALNSAIARWPGASPSDLTLPSVTMAAMLPPPSRSITTSALTAPGRDRAHGAGQLIACRHLGPFEVGGHHDRRGLDQRDGCHLGAQPQRLHALLRDHGNDAHAARQGDLDFVVDGARAQRGDGADELVPGAGLHVQTPSAARTVVRGRSIAHRAASEIAGVRHRSARSARPAACPRAVSRVEPPPRPPVERSTSGSPASVFIGVDRVPGGLVADAMDLGGAGDRAVVGHCTQQVDALATAQVLAGDGDPQRTLQLEPIAGLAPT